MNVLLDVHCISNILVFLQCIKEGKYLNACYLALNWVGFKIFNCPSTQPQYNSACSRITSYKLDYSKIFTHNLFSMFTFGFISLIS